MSDPVSMDFLGQKRRVRPVRKVQVSTHFDELNLATGLPSTPEPPALDEAILKEVKTDSTEKVTVPAPRSAVYATKLPSPPAEMNTLVPEDFNFLDFGKSTKKEEVVRTDNSFTLPKDENSKIDKDSKKEPVVAAAAVTATAAAATTAAILSTKVDATKKEMVEKDSILKGPDSQKPIDTGKNAPVSVKPEPIIIAEVPKTKTPEVSKKTESIAPAVVAAALVTSKKTEEVAPPPPLPTDTAYLVAARESLKPSMLPVKPVNGAPSTEPGTVVAGSPLAKSGITAEELEKLKKDLEKQKLALEREMDDKKILESQIQALISKSNAQEETIKYKNDSLEQLQSDYLKTNNDLTSARSEKMKLEEALAKAEEELSKTSESNAKAYLEKSDEISALKDKLAEFAAIIGQKNKEIESLQRQLEDVKRSNVKSALENVEQYEKLEDELVKIVEEEILRMQDTIEEQREYNAKLQLEVDSEYAYWKRRLAETASDDKK